MSGGRGISLVAAVAFGAGVMIAACAQRAVPSQPPAVQEIAMLWGQIRDWRHEARMRVEPSAALVNAFLNNSASIKKVCPDGHKPPPACDDICNPAEAICENKDRICELARELADTQWAQWSQEKCASANASCHEASDRCCSCEHRVEDGAE